MELQKIKISAIKVKDRLRENIGDLTALQKSIRKIGLIQPILVSRNLELISGFRRLQSCRNLGFEKIDAIISDLEPHDALGKLECECHENLGRNELTNEEFEKYLLKKQKLSKFSIWNRIKNWAKRVWFGFLHLLRLKRKNQNTI